MEPSKSLPTRLPARRALREVLHWAFHGALVQIPDILCDYIPQSTSLISLGFLSARGPGGATGHRREHADG